jgi:peptidoglycan-associated lipoprotein
MFKKVLMLFFVLGFIASCRTTPDGDYETLDGNEESVMLNESEDIENTEVVIVPDKIYFALDSYEISQESSEVLASQVEWLQDKPELNIIVEGYCDERGTREYNLALGNRRANSVKKYLIKSGIPAKRIKIVSYGKERPLVIGTGERVWAKNRAAVTVQTER